MENTTMEKSGFQLFYCLSFFIFLNMSITSGATDQDRKVHIVYMGSLPEGEYSPSSSYHSSMLQEVVENSSVENILVRSYNRSFNGFAANLTKAETEKLASMKEVVSVFPSRTLQLHTTRSWDFMGLNQSISRNSSAESDVIVGVIDTGVWPESESFNDEGFGPPPKKWKGACEGGQNFNCNNKMIGARHYSSTDTARDEVGHGTHTASTVAGNNVEDASFYGLAQGTARGGVPSARIAIYKACSMFGCQGADILAAFDDAIADGVDLITISVGRLFASEFYKDPISIGSFHAMAKGILTLNSVGNAGPDEGSTASVAPWMVSVAASTTDRLFIDKVVLGNGETLVGYSINAFSLNGRKFPLIYGKDVSSNCSEFPAKNCAYNCVDSSLVREKIVVCNRFDGSYVAHQAGAAGSILKNVKVNSISFIVSLPASAVNPDNFDRMISYMNSTKTPQAEILKTEVIEDSTAPVVAPFSSRGPNKIVAEIMKPDISAPGVDILAAFSPIAPISKDTADKRHVKHNIMSGTSMACPHAAGVAAYVKSFHPDWSPSAIKSAIMTTAWPMNSSENSEAEYAYGSGHINPVKAINPGLVYDALKSDYITMLCSIGYDMNKIRVISGDNSTCPEGSGKASPKDLNYPSMAAEVAQNTSFTIKFHRTVTNVGLANSTYKAKILSNPEISVTVVPGALSFKSLNEKESFDVIVSGRGLPFKKIVSASLVWSDGNHTVRSPIVVYSNRVLIKNST